MVEHPHISTSQTHLSVPQVTCPHRCMRLPARIPRKPLRRDIRRHHPRASLAVWTRAISVLFLKVAELTCHTAFYLGAGESFKSKNRVLQ